MGRQYPFRRRHITEHICLTVFITAHRFPSPRQKLAPPSSGDNGRVLQQPPRVGSPPESPGQIAFFAPGSRIVPERSKRFLEQIDSIDLQVQRFELTQSDVLFVGEIPRVF